jgi:hypothetical protein
MRGWHLPVHVPNTLLWTKHAGHAMQTPLLEMRDMTWHVNVAKVAIHPKMILFAFFQKRRLFCKKAKKNALGISR